MKKIRIIEPPHTRRLAPAQTATIGASTNSTTEVPTVSRKRPFDNIDDSSAYNKQEQKQQRPCKRARIDVHALVFPELYDNPQPCSKKKPQPSPTTSVNQVQRFSIFPKPSVKSSRAVNQRFLSQIRRQTPTDETPNDIS